MIGYNTRLFKSTVIIPRENYEKVARSMLDVEGLVLYVDRNLKAVDIITDTFGVAGFATCHPYNVDGIGFDRYRPQGGLPLSTNVRMLEMCFKAISRFVEPGSYVELESDGELVERYVFLYDHIERWTAPRILYDKKEVV